MKLTQYERIRLKNGRPFGAISIELWKKLKIRDDCRGGSVIKKQTVDGHHMLQISTLEWLEAI